MQGTHFPEGFLWGAATAAHQIEGNNVHSDWWRAEQAGLLPERSGLACDSWNRWRDDIRLLQDIGLNAYRLSLEWARIEPEPGHFDQTALDTYRSMLEALREAGIEPLVTLHHFTSPAWLADRGGWRNPDVVPRLTAYADRVARATGDLVRWWVTINEPSVLGYKAYLDGSWPPNRSGDLRGYVRVQRYAARAHRAMRQALKRATRRCSGQPGFLRLADTADAAMESGRSADGPAGRLGVPGRLLDRTLDALDWIGVNYYSRTLVGWHWPLAGVPVAIGPGERTDFGWEIYPSGLYDVLRRVGRYGLPVMITENGIADADDDQRPDYIVSHLRQAQRAIADGVDLRGYMHWTLLDNYEWAAGYSQRFGLATRERELRPSAQVYAAIARANGLV